MVLFEFMNEKISCMCSTKFFECPKEIYSYFVHARLKFVYQGVKRTKVEIFSAEKLTVQVIGIPQLWGISAHTTTT